MFRNNFANSFCAYSLSSRVKNFAGLLFLCGLFGTTLLATRLDAANPPDLDIYLADDLSFRDLSIYADRGGPTPALEALAADGMTFDLAFVASPSCAPSRAALLTGLMPARNGAE